MADPAPPSPADGDPNPETAARDQAKGLIKEVLLEVIAEREAAPPKGKKVDVLGLLFGTGS